MFVCEREEKRREKLNREKDGFEYVSDVGWDIVRDFRGSYVSIHVVIEETGEQRGLLSEPDP